MQKGGRCNADLPQYSGFDTMGFKVASRVASKVARLHFRDATLAVVPFFGCNFFSEGCIWNATYIFWMHPWLMIPILGCNLGCNLQFLDATFFPKVAFWDATLVAGLHFKVASKE